MKSNLKIKWLFGLIAVAVIGFLISVVPLDEPGWFVSIRAAGLCVALLFFYLAAALSLWDARRGRSAALVIAAIISITSAAAVTIYLFELFRSDV
jgi:uncharacterized membrane protein YfhO